MKKQNLATGRKKYVSLSLLMLAAVALQTGIVAASAAALRRSGGEFFKGVGRRGAQLSTRIGESRVGQFAQQKIFTPAQQQAQLSKGLFSELGDVIKMRRSGQMTNAQAMRSAQQVLAKYKTQAAVVGGLAVGTLIAAGAMIRSLRGRGDRGDMVERAAKLYSVDLNKGYNEDMLIAFSSNQMAPILTIYSQIKSKEIPVLQVSLEAIEAAAYLAKQAGNEDAYSVAVDLYGVRQTPGPRPYRLDLDRLGKMAARIGTSRGVPSLRGIGESLPRGGLGLGIEGGREAQQALKQKPYESGISAITGRPVYIGKEAKFKLTN